MAHLIGFFICLAFYIVGAICTTPSMIECTDGVYQIMTEKWGEKAPQWTHVLIYVISPLWLFLYLPILLVYLAYAIYKLVKAKQEIKELLEKRQNTKEELQ